MSASATVWAALAGTAMMPMRMSRSATIRAMSPIGRTAWFAAWVPITPGSLSNRAQTSNPLGVNWS